MSESGAGQVAGRCHIVRMHAGPRCVLVDDDADFSSMIRQFLRRICPGLEVVAFADGLAALAFLTTSEADLVLTDFRMPQMNGIELTRRLRALARQTPIVVMSGNAVEAQALAAGANAFLSKSALPGRLGTMLASLGFQCPGPLSSTTPSA